MKFSEIGFEVFENYQIYTSNALFNFQTEEQTKKKIFFQGILFRNKINFIEGRTIFGIVNFMI